MKRRTLTVTALIASASGALATVLSSFYLVVSSMHHHTRSKGVEPIDGWWQLALSVIVAVFGLVMLVAEARHTRKVSATSS